MSNPLEKRMEDALKTLINEYGLPATKVAKRSGVDLGIIRRVRNNRYAGYTIEDVQKLEALIREIKTDDTNDPSHSRLEQLEEDVNNMKEENKRLALLIRRLLAKQQELGEGDVDKVLIDDDNGDVN